MTIPVVTVRQQMSQVEFNGKKFFNFQDYDEIITIAIVQSGELLKYLRLKKNL